MGQARHEVIVNLGGKPYIFIFRKGGSLKKSAEITTGYNKSYSVTGKHDAHTIEGEMFFDEEQVIPLQNDFTKRAYPQDNSNPPEHGTLTHNTYHTNGKIDSCTYDNWNVANDIASELPTEGEEGATIPVKFSVNKLISSTNTEGE